MATHKSPSAKNSSTLRTAPKVQCRKTLTLEEAHIAAASLVRQLERTASSWDVRGWGFARTTKGFRFVLEVPRLIRTPRSPVELLRLPASVGGRFLKPDVRASFARGKATLHLFDAASGVPTAAVSEPLAPGSPIVVRSQPKQLCGLAFVLSCDGAPYLVTAGHVFAPSAIKTEVEVRGEVAAKLTRNFLEDDRQVDAAICALTSSGRRLLSESSAAPTWATDHHAPHPSDEQKRATFFPARSAASALTAAIDSSAFFQSDLWNRYWDLSLRDLIQCPPISEEGDSGSPLFLGRAFYGLCTGAVGVHSYFTSFSHTVRRIKRHFQEVRLWVPQQD